MSRNIVILPNGLVAVRRWDIPLEQEELLDNIAIEIEERKEAKKALQEQRAADELKITRERNAERELKNATQAAQ